MVNAMRLLVLLCALTATQSTASHCGGVCSARTRARAPLASSCCDHEEDPRHGGSCGAIFLTKWLHTKTTLTRSTTAVTSATHTRTFAEPERALPSGREGSHVRPATERELGGSDPRRWRRSALWVRGGKRTTDEDQYDREQQTVRNVLLYYPNLIGYARVALVLTSYYLAETNWKASSCLYVVAFAGDAVDGHVARKFNQASRFGAVLDMVTDRCSTAGLLLVLSRLYDHSHAFAFLVLMFLDLSSHWMHTHSVVDKHHKATTTLRRRNALIRTYYDNLPFFAFCCIGTELFYVLLYLLHFISPDSRAFGPLRKLCYGLCLPACALKQLINVAQTCSAARTLALADVDRTS